jgi:GTP-binding protein
MVVGTNRKAGDIIVNICRTKELTNFRSKNQGIQEGMEVPKEMSLEDALEYISDDELVEVTPKSIRIRKAALSESDRKRQARASD